MIKFDLSKIEIKRVKLKSLNSMSGSLQIVDETITDREKTYKLDCPKIIANAYRKFYGMTNYTVPQECAIMTFDGKVVALERAPVNSRFVLGLFEDQVEWTPKMEAAFKKIQQLMKHFSV